MTMMLSSLACSSRSGTELSDRRRTCRHQGEFEAGGHTNWPVFRGNAQANRRGGIEAADQPELLWKYAVEKGAFEATPVVAGTVYIGDLDGVFYALDLKSGDERWKFNTRPTRWASTRRRRCAMDWCTSATSMASSIASMPKPAKKMVGQNRRRNRFGSQFLQRSRAVRFARCHALLPGRQNRRAAMEASNRRSNSLLAHGDSGSLLSGRLRWQAACDRSGQRRGNRVD